MSSSPSAFIAYLAFRGVAACVLANDGFFFAILAAVLDMSRSLQMNSFLSILAFVVSCLVTIAIVRVAGGLNCGCGLTIASRILHGFGVIPFLLPDCSSSFPSGKSKSKLSIKTSSTFTGSSLIPAASTKRISIENGQYLFNWSISQAALHEVTVMRRQNTVR